MDRASHPPGVMVVRITAGKEPDMGNGNLFSIGEVAKITGVHVKSLRYYDRIGVFVPAYVDERSGYRYYSFDQLQKILAVRTCLDSGIILSDMGGYIDNGAVEYERLISDARTHIEDEIRVLEKRKSYLDFLRYEVEFNNNDKTAGSECYGSLALFRMPYEGDIDDFDRKEMLVRLAAEAAKRGYQIYPLYFGMLMTCEGTERRTYAIAGVEDFLNMEDDDNIYHTPDAWYRRAVRPDLDVTAADEVFPDLFALDYDKTVLTTISLHSTDDEMAYSMFINLPEGYSGRENE